MLLLLPVLMWNKSKEWNNRLLKVYLISWICVVNDGLSMNKIANKRKRQAFGIQFSVTFVAKPVWWLCSFLFRWFSPRNLPFVLSFRSNQEIVQRVVLQYKYLWSKAFVNLLFESIPSGNVSSTTTTTNTGKKETSNWKHWYFHSKFCFVL